MNANSAWLVRVFPALRWWPLVDRGTLRADFAAGAVGAIIVLPQGIAFAIPVNAVTMMLMLLLFPLFYALHQYMSQEKTLSDLDAGLVVFGPGAVANTIPLHNFEGMPQAEWPVLDIAGWWHAGARTLGKGRVVLLGEAAMCSAQLAGPERWTMGMNHPKAAQNAQFCLSSVRWLTGVLEPM